MGQRKIYEINFPDPKLSTMQFKMSETSTNRLSLAVFQTSVKSEVGQFSWAC